LPSGAVESAVATVRTAYERCGFREPFSFEVRPSAGAHRVDR
jgi:hypothetical protein